MRMPILLIVAVLLRLAAAEQVELTLADGRVVSGTVVEETADKVVVESRMAGRKSDMMVRQTVTVAQITARRTIASPIAEYPRMAGEAGNTAAAQLGLADWCRTNGLAEQAVTHGKRCLELDPANERGRLLMATLGFHQHEGAWLPEADYLTKTGKVRYQGKVVTPAEATALQAADAAEVEERKADQAASESMVGVKRVERQLKTLDAQIVELEKQHATATADLAAAKAATAAHEAAKNELTAAVAAADAEQSSQNAVSATTQERKNSAQSKLAKAKRAAGSAPREATSASATIQRLETKRTTLQTQRIQVQADLAKATEQAAKAKQAAEAAPAPAPKP